MIRWQDYIEEKPGVLCGKPVMKGTRIAMEFLMGRLKVTPDDASLLSDFPSLQQVHLDALRSMRSSPNDPEAFDILEKVRVSLAREDEFLSRWFS
ncbi:MAG: DUF433 domain-containing protein [Gemmataceae bacterium]